MLIFFLAVDYVMIIKVINPIFQSNVGELFREQPKLTAAAFFYIFYVSGIYWFGTLAGLRTGSVLTSILSGSFLGLLAYATYEVTNFSLIKGWTVQMVVLDTAWGGALGGLTAAVGYYVNKAMSS
tara:strand:+ start:204 stop:578 length:375 start_codon:yes stop_codon:yes gene_type:complete